MTSSIVQYIVVRGDLLKTLNWPVGALLAQACHASSVAIHLFYQDTVTQEYLKNLDSMHKVVLDGKDEETIKSLESVLVENNVQHKLWIEQPENFPTCLATKPYHKKEIEKHFKKLKLFK